MTPNNQQRGSTLLVALIMLVLLTLIALSAIDSTTTSVQMVGNAQFREEAIAAAQQVVEIVASDNNFMLTHPFPQSTGGKPIDVNNDGITDYTVTIEPKPSCLKSEPVSVGDPGVPADCASSSNIGAVCYWTVWDIRAVVNDPATGASVVLHQGVNVLAGWKAAAESCR